MHEINWPAAEKSLYEGSSQAILEFAKEHHGEEVSFFAYRADYCYGQIYLCMDTPNNARKQAIEHSDRIEVTRRKLFDQPHGWNRARYFVARHSDRMLDYTYATGLFQYDAFAHIQFPDWEEYFRSDHYGDDYQLENRVIVLLWKVLEQLRAARAFDGMILASPFRTGFEFCDNDLGLVVMQLLNWPSRR